jgi:cytochrome c oxidase accessory protein FixG
MSTAFRTVCDRLVAIGNRMNVANAATQVSLYEKWRKIYPLSLYGGYQRWRRVVLSGLVAIYYVGPWLQRNGDPLFWLNLPERKFVVFGVTYWPQEFVLVSWLLMLAALGLFIVTVVAGRVWCGWACPQTVWTLVYFFIEQKIEGPRTQRMRLDQGGWNRKRIGKKLIKWTLWAGLAFSISFTFLAYFLRPDVLIEKTLTLSLSQAEWFWLLFPAASSFLVSGVLREQVCFHMCPYARFQSVMFDRDTLIISYDEDRGEPRGHKPRRADPAAPVGGDCVDCNRCVHACPTGIDIRDGLQYQCIACAACIDACDEVMLELGQETNLIRYSSQTRDRGETVSRLRPRLVGYIAVFSAIALGFVWTIGHRIPLELDIIRDRGRLFREHWDGSIENTYRLRIINRENQSRRYRLRAEANFPLKLQLRGEPVVDIAAGEQLAIGVQLVSQAAPDEPENRPVRFVVEAIVEANGQTEYTVQEESRFIQPAAPAVPKNPSSDLPPGVNP